jgi:hypothetical protein
MLWKDDVEVVSTYDFKMQCWSEEELQRYIFQAGFESILYFGAYDRTKAVGASDRLIVVASRVGVSD